jgi:hypothetical protein
MMTCTAAMALVSLSLHLLGKLSLLVERRAGQRHLTLLSLVALILTSGIKHFGGDGNINDGAVSYYSPNNVYVASNGNLRLVANNNSENGKPYTGGVITTYGSFIKPTATSSLGYRFLKGRSRARFLLISRGHILAPELNIFEIPGVVRVLTPQPFG